MSEFSAFNNLGDCIRTIYREGRFIDLGLKREIPWDEFHQMSRCFAAHMLARGVKRGQRVALLAYNGAHFMCAYLGLMMAGAIVVPINYRLTKDTIQYILDDCNAAAVLFDDSLAHLVPSSIRSINLADVALRPADSPAVIAKMNRDEIAQILYTSGSTGAPKGVPLSHYGQIWVISRLLGAVGQRPPCTIISAPTYHMNGLVNSTLVMARGGVLVSVPKFEAGDVLQAISRYRVTYLTGVPTMFAMMTRSAASLSDLDLSSVKEITIGSAPLTLPLIERVKAVFPEASVRNTYGTTETGAAIFGPHPDGRECPLLALGYPVAGTEWKFMEGQSAVEGILASRTPAMLKAYLNLPEKTADRIREGWYISGDVMKRDADGFFYFVGRADDMFVCGGENLYPGDIEKLLERHVSVLQAAVVSIEDDIKGAVPVAFITVVPGSSVTGEEVKAFTLAHGPAFSHPRSVHIIEKMPVNGAQKIDKLHLTELAKKLKAEF